MADGRSRDAKLSAGPGDAAVRHDHVEYTEKVEIEPFDFHRSSSRMSVFHCSAEGTSSFQAHLSNATRRYVNNVHRRAVVWLREALASLSNRRTVPLPDFMDPNH